MDEEKHFLPVAASPHVSGPELDCLPWGQPAECPQGLRLRRCGPVHVLSQRECLRGGGQVGIKQEEGPSAGNTQDGVRGAGPVPTLALDAPETRLLCSPLCICS